MPKVIQWADCFCKFLKPGRTGLTSSRCNMHVDHEPIHFHRTLISNTAQVFPDALATRSTPWTPYESTADRSNSLSLQSSQPSPAWGRKKPGTCDIQSCPFQGNNTCSFTIAPRPSLHLGPALPKCWPLLKSRLRSSRPRKLGKSRWRSSLEQEADCPLVRDDVMAVASAHRHGLAVLAQPTLVGEEVAGGQLVGREENQEDEARDASSSRPPPLPVGQKAQRQVVQPAT